ncbi:MAG: radical SAM protein [Candidatus Verstraetearchaeota archaeon]|nr:radical SAM protein [Candidatus Verstraetearchaeota archaeon]
MRFIHRFDPWRGKLCTCPLKYTLDPYTGCGHRCRYCYITSYIRDGFNPRPKAGLIEGLKKDLVKLNPEIPISISNSSDPYTPPDEELELTRKALEVILPRGFKVLLVTKSSLVLRDLKLIARGNCSVSMTITTLDEVKAKRMEPRAPPPSQRLKALATLTSEGVPCSLRLDPIVPGYNSGEDELKTIIKEAAKAGVEHVVTSTFKPRPDGFKRVVSAFPELKQLLRRLYYEEGRRISGARYLADEKRRELLKMVKELAEAEGLTFAACREGFPELHSAPSCDGTHLIPIRIRVAGLTGWSTGS